MLHITDRIQKYILNLHSELSEVWLNVVRINEMLLYNQRFSESQQSQHAILEKNHILQSLGKRPLRLKFEGFDDGRNHCVECTFGIYQSFRC
jgi:hypothetical protein